MKKTVITESDEQMIGNRFRTLESAVEYELPEEYYETKKEHKAGKVIYYVLSAAALFGVTFGIWYAAQYAKNYTPPGPKPASTYTATNFPYEEPVLTEEERADITALLEEIADEIIQSGQYTAKQYEEQHADKIDAAVAYGAKIFRPLVKVLDEKVPNHKNSEPTVTDLVFADICKRIIKENGEENEAE